MSHTARSLLARLLAAFTLATLLFAAAQAQVLRQPVGTPVVPTAEVLLGWAETAYAQYFPGPQPTLSYQQYLYRYYPATRNYVGVAGNDVYIWGPVSGNAPAPVKVGVLADFACPVTPAPCGVKFSHRMVVGGLEREFIVYQSWGAQTNAPVVFMLHGTSGDGEKFYNISGWREKADQQGLIAVFPSALVHCFYEDENRNGLMEAGERKLTTKWAAGYLGEAAHRPLCTAADLAQLSADRRALADHPLADDMGFFAVMVEILRTRYLADMKRVYLSGFSNGAEMSARLATEASTTYAAAGVNASSLHVPAIPAPRAMSLLWAIGELDPDIGSNQLGYLNGVPLDATVMANPAFVNRIVLPFSMVMRIDPTVYTHRVQTAYGTAISQLLFAAGTAGNTNTFRTWVIAGAGHQYPNGDNHPVKMAELLWEFFKDQRLP